MRKLMVATALLLGLSIAKPAAAHAGFFFSFSQPGFGLSIGGPSCHRPAYYYPPPPVVYVPPPPPVVVYGGYHPYPSWGRHRGWDHHYRGRRWR